MAVYPGSIATFVAVTDTTGTVSTGPSDHAALHNQANGEVVAIETTLGTNAAGTDGTVAAKLIRIDGQSTGTGYVPTTFQLNGIALTGASATLGSAQVVCIGTNQLSTDGAMISDSNNLVPSQKAVVTYVAAQITGSGGTVTSVTSTNAYIQVANPTTAPVLTLNTGTSSAQIPVLNVYGAPPTYYPYVKVSETETSGTAGGTATSGSWITRVLNTTDNDTNSISSLGSNQVTLPAGTYLVKASAPFYNVTQTQVQIRLRNITAGSTLVLGQNGSFTASGGSVRLDGIFTLASPSAIALQYQVAATQATFGLGVAGSFGTEVYTVVEFTKIA